MKALIYRYGSICEPDVIEQFQNLGLEMDIIDTEVTNKKLTSENRVSLIDAKLSKSQYALVFSINFYPAISEICNIYKVPYVCWSVDAPVPELFHKSVQNPCNRIFCFDRKQYEAIHRYNPNCIYHLPLGTNVARWDKVISTITASDRAKYSSDISFVGSLYTEYDPLLKVQLSDYAQGFTYGLYQSQRLIQGFNVIENAVTEPIVSELKEKLPDQFALSPHCVKNIDSFIASQSILSLHVSSLERQEFLKTLAEHHKVDLYTRSDISLYSKETKVTCHPGISTLTEMPKVFNLSKINLNMTIHSIQTGISLRLFDIMGCGGFLLTNFQEEMLDYFEPGVDFDYYSSIEELIDKCDYYLSHDDERKKIALSGYEKVKQYHTYMNRLPQMFKALL